MGMGNSNVSGIVGHGYSDRGGSAVAAGGYSGFNRRSSKHLPAPHSCSPASHGSRNSLNGPNSYDLSSSHGRH